MKPKFNFLLTAKHFTATALYTFFCARFAGLNLELAITLALLSGLAGSTNDAVCFMRHRDQTNILLKEITSLTQSGVNDAYISGKPKPNP